MRLALNTFLATLCTLATLISPALGQVQENEEESVPFLRDIPLLAEMFEKTEEPTTHKKIPDASFFERHISSTLLTKIPELKSISMTETKRSVITRTGTSSKAERKLEFQGSDEAKAEAQSLLTSWEAHKNKVISIEFRLIARTNNRSKSTLQRPLQYFSAAEHKKLMLSIKKNSESTIVTAPKVSVLQGQKASVSVINEIAYIKDFDLQVAESAIIMDPMIAVAKDGLTLTATPVIDLDGKGVALEIQAEAVSIKRPIEQVVVKGVENAIGDLTIQVPHIFRSILSSSTIHVTNEKPAFRLSGIRVLKGDWTGKSGFYDVVGLVKIISK